MDERHFIHHSTFCVPRHSSFAPSPRPSPVGRGRMRELLPNRYKNPFETGDAATEVADPTNGIRDFRRGVNISKQLPNVRRHTPNGYVSGASSSFQVGVRSRG